MKQAFPGAEEAEVKSYGEYVWYGLEDGILREYRSKDGENWAEAYVWLDTPGFQ